MRGSLYRQLIAVNGKFWLFI